MLHSGWPEAQPQFVVPISNPLSEEEFFEDEEPEVTRGVFRRGERGAVVRKNKAAKAGPKSKPAGFKFFPGLVPLDPIVAVSPNYIVMTDAGSDPNAPGGGGRIIFLGKAEQKSNKQAVPLAPGPGGAPTKLTLTEFFGGLIAPTNPDGGASTRTTSTAISGSARVRRSDATRPSHRRRWSTPGAPPTPA